MGLFDDQIKARKLNDDAEFENSFLNIARAVTGHIISEDYKNDRVITKDAIDAILKFYKADAVDIPESLESPDEQLEYALRPSGIMKRRVKLSGGWYKNAFGAMLGVRKDDNTITALIPGKFTGYSYYDPGTGQSIPVTKKNEGLFKEDAYCFYTTFPNKKLNIRDIIGYCLSVFTAFDYAGVVIAWLISAFLGLILPAINKEIFENVIVQKDIRYLLAIAVFLVCSSVSKLIFTTAGNILTSRISTKMDVTVKAAALIRVLSLPADFFRKFSAGELSSRVNYLEMLCGIMINVLLNTGLTSLLSLIYVFQIFHYAPALAAPAIVITLASALVSVISTLMDMKISQKRMEAASKVSGLAFAFISGIQKLKLSGSEKRAFAKWGNEYAKQVELTYNFPKFIAITPVITNTIMLIGNFIMYKAAIDTGVSVADFYAFNASYGFITIAFTTLSGVTSQVSQIRPILKMLSPILDEVPETSDKKMMVEHISGGLEINNLCFRYNEGMPNVIDGLSLKIKSGQYVAIVGKTGCGKSTLMRLLLGFEKADKGAIYYDGKDINTLDLKSLRKNIGVVMQNGDLFEGSIFSNIAISNPHLTLDEAFEAARMSGMDKDINDMPMGMFTMVSEGGGGISGGQKQRLMIARAIASKPKLLLFDEATSALDNITQKTVSDALKELKCTRVVIAHRLSTIKECDRIIVLDSGKIAEDGTYDELMNKKGLFAQLVKRQQ